MREANQKVLDSVREKLEAEGFPVPPALTGKLSTEDSLILHVFLDHLYSQVLPNLKQAHKELDTYVTDTESPTETIIRIFDWLGDLVVSLSEGYNIFAEQVEVIPDLTAMDAFRKKLEEEVEYAMNLSLESIAERQGLELNGSGSTNSN